MTLVAVALLATVAVAGCDRTQTIDTSLATAPALPAEYQGRWRFDRAATIAAWETTLPPEKLQQQMQFVAMLDQLEHPIHSDLHIDGAAIIGEHGGGGVEPQYDFTEWSSQEGVIRGNAWWHEDRHDPGDRSMQAMALQIRDGTLWLGYGDGRPETLWLVFGKVP